MRTFLLPIFVALVVFILGFKAGYSRRQSEMEDAYQRGVEDGIKLLMKAQDEVFSLLRFRDAPEAERLCRGL